MLYRYLVKNPACVFALIAITLLSGCANYQLGDSAPLPFRTLYILPAANDSFAPLAVSTVSAEIREAFIRDGRVKLVANEENAEDGGGWRKADEGGRHGEEEEGEKGEEGGDGGGRRRE